MAERNVPSPRPRKISKSLFSPFTPNGVEIKGRGNWQSERSIAVPQQNLDESYTRAVVAMGHDDVQVLVTIEIRHSKRGEGGGTVCVWSDCGKIARRSNTAVSIVQQNA